LLCSSPSSRTCWLGGSEPSPNLPEWHHRHSWQLTAELLLTAAKDPGEIEACTQQIERALFLQANWVLPED
jgi:hypothetical protein